MRTPLLFLLIQPFHLDLSSKYLVYFQQAKSLNIGSSTFSKEVDKEIARAVIDDDTKLNEIFEEIDQATEVGQFTQDEPAQEDQEVEQEQI